MIQYKHYHDIDEGYKDLLSRGETAETMSVFSTLGAFTRRDASCFTYCPMGNTAYMLQVTTGDDIFSHGFAVEMREMGDTYPVEYIGQLETRLGRIDKDPDGVHLAQGALPRRLANCNFTLARTLKPILPQLVEALLYTDMPVVLVGKNTEELISYVKLTLRMLPLQFARTVGFSVCPASLPSFFGNSSEELGRGVRFVATDADIVPVDGWVVIRVDQATLENEDLSTLHPYSRMIEEMGRYITTGNESRVTQLHKNVAPAFASDGSVNHEMLNSILVAASFENNRNEENARALLRAYREDRSGVIKYMSVVGAVNLLFDRERVTLSDEEEALIDGARQDEQVNRLICDRCGNYALQKLARGKSLTEAQSADVLAFLKGLKNEELSEEGQALAPLFGTPTNRNKEVFRLLCTAYAETKRQAYLSLIYRYVHIQDTYNCYQLSQEDFDAALFQVAGEFGKLAEKLCGTILLSCYLPNISRHSTEHRLSALIAYVGSQYKTPLACMQALMWIKIAVEQCANELGVDIYGPEDFAFLPNQTVAALVDRLSFGECLTLINAKNPKASDYSRLYIELVKRLTDLETAIPNITKENIREYAKFFNLLDVRERPDAIRTHMAYMERSGKVGDEIAEYRRRFVLESYCNLSAASRARVAKRVGAKAEKTYSFGGRDGTGPDDIRDILEDENAGAQERQQVTEEVINAMKDRGQSGKVGHSNRDSRTLMLSYGFSILSILLAAVILLTPPILIASMLGTSVIARVVSYLNWYHLIAILGVGLLNFLAYFISWIVTKHDRLASIKRSIRFTLLYGLLPVFLYATVYLLTYFFL